LWLPVRSQHSLVAWLLSPVDDAAEWLGEKALASPAAARAPQAATRPLRRHQRYEFTAFH
jgi:hypothetical protein